MADLTRGALGEMSRGVGGYVYYVCTYVPMCNISMKEPTKNGRGKGVAMQKNRMQVIQALVYRNHSNTCLASLSFPQRWEEIRHASLKKDASLQFAFAIRYTTSLGFFLSHNTAHMTGGRRPHK